MMSSSVQVFRPHIEAKTNGGNPDLIRVTITEGAEFALTMNREAWESLLYALSDELGGHKYPEKK